jgi:hypothetical protein
VNARGDLGRVAVASLIAIAHQHHQNIALRALEILSDLLQRGTDRSHAFLRRVDRIHPRRQSRAVERP